MALSPTLRRMMPQAASTAARGGGHNQLQHLDLENSAGVRLPLRAAVNGNLDLARQRTVPTGVTLSGIQMLFLRSTSVLNNQGTIQTAACTREPGHTINGTDPCQ
jgi:hypothetical protein